MNSDAYCKYLYYEYIVQSVPKHAIHTKLCNGRKCTHHCESMLFAVCIRFTLQYHIYKKHLYFAQTNTFWEKTVHDDACQYAYKACPQNILCTYHNQLGPHWQSIQYLQFDQARTNSAMTHVLVLSAKVRRNAWLW